MTNLSLLSVNELLQGLGNGDFSAVEIAKDYLARIKSHESWNCYLTVDEQHTINLAKKSDTNRRKGNIGLLEGIPIAIKDSFCTKGIKTTAASNILDSFVPPYEAFVTNKLWDKGAILLGKTNMDEFSMGSANTNTPAGVVVNPWSYSPESSNENSNTSSKLNIPRVAGGSSGGSAAAVAGRLAPVALGGDTGGSVRQPASFCGVVGIKPSYGRCSRFGLISFASSLDQAGVLAGNVSDAGLILESIMGYDSHDSTSVDMVVPKLSNITDNDSKNIKCLKIGLPKEYLLNEASADIKKSIQKTCEIFKEMGAEIIDISLPHTKYALAVYYIISSAEASSNLSRYDGVRFGVRPNLSESSSIEEMYMLTRSTGFGREVKRRVLIGTFVLSSGYYDAYYRKAQQVRRLIVQDFKNAFKDVDVILTPTTPTSCFPIDKPPSTPVEMYQNDIFTVPASLAGLPGISLPISKDSKDLPIGIQLIAPAWQEKRLLTCARAVEIKAEFKPWHINNISSFQGL